MPATTDPDDPLLREIRPDGQQRSYLVLSEEERARGFIRPVRTTYKHIGSPGPRHPLRDLTPEEKERYREYGYVKFEAYPPDGSSVVGRYWTQDDLDRAVKGCGAVTTMGQALAETWARDIHFYGGTYCCACGKHFPIRNPDGSPAFLWEPDGSPVGS